MVTETQTPDAIDPEAKEIKNEALAWPEQANAIEITDQQTYDEASTFLADIARLKKKIVDHHKPIKEATNAAHRAAVAAEKELLAPISEAEKIIKAAIGEWTREQQAIEAARQKRLRELQQKADEDARLALAAQAEDAGACEETVDEILNTQIVRPVVAVGKPVYRKAPGVSTQQRWKAEVVDIRLLCRAIADGKASSELVQPNMTALNGMARAMRQTFSVPGCQAITETSVAIRSAS